MKLTQNQNISSLKGEFSEPPPSKPTLSFGYKLHPSLKAMVWAQPFLGHDNENPCHHLHEFEEMCLCLSISGMNTAPRTHAGDVRGFHYSAQRRVVLKPWLLSQGEVYNWMKSLILVVTRRTHPLKRVGI